LRRGLRCPFKGIRCGASQAPCQSRGSVVELNLAAERLSSHRADDRAAEAFTLWRSHGWSVALGPVDGARPLFRMTAHSDAARFRQEFALFASLCRKLLKCEANRLGSDRIQTQLGGEHRDPGSHEIGKLGKLCAYQILDINALPLVLPQ